MSALGGGLRTHPEDRCRGWLVVLPRRYVTALDQLTAEEGR
jgi:hypothetical protein